MGMRLVEGRRFATPTTHDAPRVAIVNEALAQRYFAGRNAVGQQLRSPASANKPLEIVGIIADTRTEALSAAAEPEIYLPFWQSGAFSKHLVVRPPAIRCRLPRSSARRLRASIRRPPSSASRRWPRSAGRRWRREPSRCGCSIGFAVVATLLALVGLYGVLSLSVGARTKEIAVRKAIGAQGRQIVRLVLGEGSRLVAVGLVLGVVVPVLVGRLLESLLFDVSRPTLSLWLPSLVFGGSRWPPVSSRRSAPAASTSWSPYVRSEAVVGTTNGQKLSCMVRRPMFAHRAELKVSGISRRRPRDSAN